MSNIIQFDPDAKKPHMRGDAVCLHCNHKWEAVALTGTKVLECPECHLNKGIFSNLVLNTMYYQCLCGSAFYSVDINKNLVCAVCGDYHSLE